MCVCVVAGEVGGVEERGTRQEGGTTPSPEGLVGVLPRKHLQVLILREETRLGGGHLLQRHIQRGLPQWEGWGWGGGWLGRHN